MKALELSRLYYEQHCAPLLEAGFFRVADRIAVGLVGDGSECFGFDDEISRDHDWGAALCLWLNQDDYLKYANELSVAINALPKTIRNYPVREETDLARGRSGILEIGSFYYRYLGYRDAPKTNGEWLKIPEERLAVATNGEVFVDPYGEFSRIREELLNFYPEDVRLKKLAARCAIMAQAGQYNFPRCIKRKEYVAANMALTEFLKAACSAFFLIKKKYKPYYKWMHKSLGLLEDIGKYASSLLEQIVINNVDEKNIALIEECSSFVVKLLLEDNLSNSTDDFLLEHAKSIQSNIKDNMIREIDVFVG